MSRTVIDVDDGALERAATVLGTTSKVETVNLALQLVASRLDDSGQAERFSDFLDFIGERLEETDVRRDAWR